MEPNEALLVVILSYDLYNTVAITLVILFYFICTILFDIKELVDVWFLHE
jgi:hypothetical protein